MTSQISDITSTSTFFDLVLFLLSSLVTGPTFMSTSSLVLELWQFSFIRGWPEIWKSEIPPSEFCPISGDWGELWLLDLARMSLTQCYWMLPNSRVTAFTVFELLRENQLGGGGKITPPHPPRLGLNEIRNNSSISYWNLIPGNQTPTDLCTRYTSFSLLKDGNTWFQGTRENRQDITE